MGWADYFLEQIHLCTCFLCVVCYIRNLQSTSVGLSNMSLRNYTGQVELTVCAPVLYPIPVLI